MKFLDENSEQYAGGMWLSWNIQWWCNWKPSNCNNRFVGIIWGGYYTWYNVLSIIHVGWYSSECDMWGCWVFVECYNVDVDVKHWFKKKKKKKSDITKIWKLQTLSC